MYKVINSKYTMFGAGHLVGEGSVIAI
jgi:hypothetical protein